VSGEPQAPLAPNPDADTVEAIVAALQEFLTTEDNREQGIHTRAAGLAVFGGVVISLVATLSRGILRVDLPGCWDATSTALFGTALLSLVASELVVLLGVLLPREAAGISLDEIDAYAEADTLASPKVSFQGSLMLGLIEILAIDRRRISAKTHRLREAYVLLVAGLLAGAALGFILGLHDSAVL
jgi:hypothetical protein